MNNKERSDKIIQWLAERPLINRRALCALVKYDTSNFLKAEKGMILITEKHLENFERELKKYGFK